MSSEMILGLAGVVAGLAGVAVGLYQLGVARRAFAAQLAAEERRRVAEERELRAEERERQAQAQAQEAEKIARIVALYGELGNRFTDMAYRMRDWKSAETGFRYAFIRGLLQDGGSSTRPLAALTAQDLLSQLGTDGRSVDRARADALEQIADEVRAVEGNEHPPDVRIEIADRLLPRLDEALMIIRSGQTEQTDGTREEPR